MLSRLLSKLKRRQATKSIGAISTVDAKEIKRKLVEIDLPAPPLPPVAPKPRGRVIKQTRHSEFNPDSNRSGGRVVKVMPRKLQKIKAAQEMVEDDDQPKVDSLED